MRWLHFGLAAWLCTELLEQTPSATPPPDEPQGVYDPKELTAPVKLVHSDIIWDGGDFGGKFRGANGKEFWFYRGGVGPSPSKWGLYVGYMSGSIPASARAAYVGWTELDFCTLLETTIRSQFRWDSQQQRLVPKDFNDFDDLGQTAIFNAQENKRLHYEGFGASGAKRMLRYAERILGRQKSYMDAEKP